MAIETICIFKKFTLPLLKCQITSLGEITHRLKTTALDDQLLRLNCVLLCHNDDYSLC